MKHIQVVAAIIIHNDKILCVQRGQNEYGYISLKYEFPGDKVKPNENDEEAIKREVKEELLMDIEVMGEMEPIENSFRQAKMPAGDGQEVPVVQIDFNLNKPVEKSLYNYITHDNY